MRHPSNTRTAAAHVVTHPLYGSDTASLIGG